MCGSDGLAAASRIPASDAMARGGWGPSRLGKRPPLHVWRKEFPRRGDKTWDTVTGVSGQRQERGVTPRPAHGDRPLLEGTGQAQEAQRPRGALEGAGQGAGQGSHSICLSTGVCSTDFHVSPLVLVQRCWGPTTSEVCRKAPLRPFPNSRMTRRLHDVNEPLVPQAAERLRPRGSQAALWAGCGTLPLPGRSGLLVLSPSDEAGCSRQSRSIT